MLKIQIYRYNPEVDKAPRMQAYAIDTRGRDLMVLDALEQLKREDATLSFRRSCREGVCGSDGININGKNGLACITRVSDILKNGDTLILRPLTGMPVIRDLVVDMDLFFRQYKKVRPWLINDDPVPAIERRQSPEDRARLDGLYECILCACCTSGCPSWWWNPDRFIGPAGLLSASRFLEDSRDTATDERLEALKDPFSVFRCRQIQNCTWVCPKGLNPMKAIGTIRTRLLKLSS
ncbi:MAG TPA: succinate dehydrogenase iron-sulfur subunit [Spongiibacteraceae bacterium]|nr:succinate dehydrogenase iron-sulfur subunit [Spongiibacteraceae bacterium]